MDLFLKKLMMAGKKFWTNFWNFFGNARPLYNARAHIKQRKYVVLINSILSHLAIARSMVDFCF